VLDSLQDPKSVLDHPMIAGAPTAIVRRRPALESNGSPEETNTRATHCFEIATGIDPRPIGDLLTCVQKGDDSVEPLVIIYANTGLSYGLSLLRRFDSNQPVYMTQNPIFTNPKMKLESFESRACHHAGVLRAVFGSRKIHLLGYSFGGALTTEIALALRTNYSITLVDPIPACVTGRKVEDWESWVSTSDLNLVMLAGSIQSLQDLDNHHGPIRRGKGRFLDRVVERLKLEAPTQSNLKSLRSDIDQVCGDPQLSAAVFMIGEHQISHCEQLIEHNKKMKHVSDPNRMATLLDPEPDDARESRVVPADATILITKFGFGFFLNDSGLTLDVAEARDGAYGWSSRFRDVYIVECQGTHHEFFQHESNVDLLASCLKDNMMQNLSSEK
jgi:hypothetical protein